MRQLRRVSELRRFTIRATDGNIGSPEEVYFDDTTWTVRYLIVNTGTWLMGRRVLIAPVAIEDLDEAGLLLQVKLTRDQVQNSPPVDTEKPISRQYETAYYRYFEWVPYWSGGLSPGLQIPPPGIAPEHMRERATERTEIGESHLRSTAEVTGYHIEAPDGGIGHVEDFIIDDEEWRIRYVEVDTRNWWPGKKVLLALAWIERITWANRTISVNLSREIIQGAPEYDPSELISPDYEVQLFKYYSQHQD